jgi:O-antigen/teichoic acid export membrane protein
MNAKIQHKPKLLKTTAIYFIGNFASKLLTFFLLPLYTAYLSPKEFGHIDLIISALPLIAPIFTLQASESIFRFLCGEVAENKRKIAITNSLVIFLIGCFVFIITYLPFSYFFQFQYSYLFFFYFVTTYIGIFLQQVLRGLNRNTDYAVSGVILTFIQALINIVLITKFNFRGDSLLISAISASLIIVLFITFRVEIWKYIDISIIDYGEIKRQLIYSIPLIPNQICWWVVGLMGRYIVLYYQGEASTGILALASKFPNLLIVVNSIFLLAWTENAILSFNMEGKDLYYTKVFNQFISIQAAILALLLPLTRIYFDITISQNYGDSWLYIPFLYIGAALNSIATYLGSFYTASMQTKHVFITTMVAGIVNILLCFLLIPFIGIYGEVIANMCSFIVLVAYRVVSVRKIIGIKLTFSKIIPNISLLILSLFVFYLNNNSQYVFMVLATIILIILNRDVLKAIYGSISKLKVNSV